MLSKHTCLRTLQVPNIRSVFNFNISLIVVGPATLMSRKDDNDRNENVAFVMVEQRLNNYGYLGRMGYAQGFELLMGVYPEPLTLSFLTSDLGSLIFL